MLDKIRLKRDLLIEGVRFIHENPSAKQEDVLQHLNDKFAGRTDYNLDPLTIISLILFVIRILSKFYLTKSTNELE